MEIKNVDVIWKWGGVEEFEFNKLCKFYVGWWWLIELLGVFIMSNIFFK